MELRYDIQKKSSSVESEKIETSSSLSHEAVTILKMVEVYREELKEYKEESDKQINEQEEKIKQIKTKFNEQKREVKNMKIDFIAVIGIFVSIFTFISIEIQILRYVCDFWRIAGFSLIIFGSLSGFVILIHSIFSQKEIKNKILIFCIVIFLLGIFTGSIPHIFNINDTCIVNTLIQ